MTILLVADPKHYSPLYFHSNLFSVKSA